MCEVEAASWVPAAVSGTLRDDGSTRPVLAWLSDLRGDTEEYDSLVTVRPPTPDHQHQQHPASPDSAFDEILSKLGKEIYKLDLFHSSLLPSQQNISLSILDIFDECLNGIGEGQKKETDEEKPESEVQDTEVKDTEVQMVTNGCDLDYSDADTSLSDVSIISSPDKDETVNGSCDVESVFVNDTVPIPAPRVRLKKVSSSSSIYESMSDLTLTELVKVNRIKSESDSESTCWSYKEINKEQDNQKTYAVVWSHSSGFHNSDAILRRVLMQHHATISQLCFDEASEFTPTQYSVYTLAEVGDRCTGAAPAVAAMTPDRPSDDAYERVRDAITDENIYEEIEYHCSLTDEGCSCGGSADADCCSIASSSLVGRDSSDSPLYVNLRDHDAYAIPPDVIFWKNLLLDPYYNDDEEDEWITPDECAVYSREQRPPLIIPRITQYRPPARRQNNNVYFESDNSRDVRLHSKAYERLQDGSPRSERGRPDLERAFSKADSDSPPFVRINRRLGTSTENLLFHNERRPTNLNIPASSSGDSLDIEMREREPGHGRRRESRSMMAPMRRMKSPVPAPRLLINQANHTSESATVLYEGSVKRTRYSESGKKSKKNWTECYMVLTTTALYFYRDQKTFYNSKLPRAGGASPAARADLVLPLRNAHVLHCIQTHTRRYTRSIMLTVDYDQYLIQDDTEDGAKRWLKYIQNIIYKLGPPLLDEPATPASASSSTDLDSLGRTPPAARHHPRKQKAGGSSNEDLSDSTEVSKTHVRSRLRKFFAKRPAMDVLIKKGIYKDEPVFGRNLEEVCPASSPRVPDFVVACVKEIEASEENMKTDGLYRASGNLSQVQKIRLEVDQNNLSVLENSSDIHVLTGSLKLFFRELKEPLIPCNLFDRVLAACSLKPREMRVKEFRDVVHSLPQCNRDTLKFLLEHLLRVTQYSEHNRMHTANLAIVFGPTLLWAPAEKAHNIAIDCIQQNNVVDILLNDYKDIFSDDKPKKKA